MDFSLRLLVYLVLIFCSPLLIINAFRIQENAFFQNMYFRWYKFQFISLKGILGRYIERKAIGMYLRNFRQGRLKEMDVAAWFEKYDWVIRKSSFSTLVPHKSLMGHDSQKWYFVTKIALTYCEKIQFFQTVKGQNNFW